MGIGGMKLPDSRIEKLVKGISIAIAPELSAEIRQLKNQLSIVMRQRDQYKAKVRQYQTQLGKGK
jgi:hypothetical protein